MKGGWVREELELQPPPRGEFWVTLRAGVAPVLMVGEELQNLEHGAIFVDDVA